MLTVITNLFPVFLFFGLGILLRKIKFADVRHGEFLLKFILFVALPSLILVKISQTHIAPEKYLLPLVSFLINATCLSLTFLFTRFIAVEKKTLGAMLVCTGIMNNMFLYPFVMYGMSDAAFSDLVLLDLGNGITTTTLVYGVTLVFGHDRCSVKTIMLKLFSSPLIWALIIAVVLSTCSIPLPVMIMGFLDPLGQMAGPLILISLGIYFAPKFDALGLLSFTIFARSGFGLLMGICLAKLFGFEGTTFAVVAISAAAPIGFTALAFSSIGKLDTDFTSNAVSFSILLGIIYIPFMLYFFNF